MKKSSIVCLLFCVCLCLCFAACDPGSYSFGEAELEDGLVSIELIDYDNPKQKSFISWVPDHSSDILPFDHQKMTVQETLPEEKHDEFVKLLAGSYILYHYYTVNSPRGLCLKLTYESGEFLVISADKDGASSFVCRYAADGRVIEYIGSIDDNGTHLDLIRCFSDDETESATEYDAESTAEELP